MRIISFILISFFINPIFSQHQESVQFDSVDKDIWHPDQTVSGKIKGTAKDELLVHYNGKTIAAKVVDGKFSVNLRLLEPQNDIWVEVPGVPSVVSDTLVYRLGYTPVPIVKPYATVSGDRATLQSVVLENFTGEKVKYIWQPDTSNPYATEVVKENDSMATVLIPEIPGEYFYNLMVITAEDTARYQTLVTRTEEELVSYNIEEGYPSWMDDAVLYQITPNSFVQDGSFDAITAKLEDLKELGITTVWLQPITETFYGGQGYDVTNYFKVNPEFGTEEDLKELVSKAKGLGLRIMFDVVLNHSSMKHPYAQDRIAKGKGSPYYDYYQREDDGAPYSSHYTYDENEFINYFWEHLPNLNYDNREVQRWMLEGVKHWVKEYDIDAYRLDAIWGVNARNPEFSERLSLELRSLKPDLLLLAEDKGSDPNVYELGYDAAYDWTTDTTWVSQWSWEYEFQEDGGLSLFEHPQVEKRDDLLREALFGNGGNAHRKLYYIENNDLPRFVSEHGLQQTKMAAALLFSTPGIPMLYNGQEIGAMGHPYRTEGIFEEDQSIPAQDEQGLFEYYQKIISLHKQLPALRGTNMKELPLTSENGMLALHRWHGEQDLVVVINLNNESQVAEIDLSTLDASTESLHFKDFLDPDALEVRNSGTKLQVPIKGHTVRWIKIKE